MEEGMLNGRQEGRQEGIEEVALRMLGKGMTVDDVCSITKLSRTAVSKLERGAKRRA